MFGISTGKLGGSSILAEIRLILYVPVRILSDCGLSFNALKPSGKYMYHLPYQPVTLHFILMSFFMILAVNSAYFLKQH
jgi:hypothetical protein